MRKAFEAIAGPETSHQVLKPGGWASLLEFLAWLQWLILVVAGAGTLLTNAAPSGPRPAQIIIGIALIGGGFVSAAVILVLIGVARNVATLAHNSIVIAERLRPRLEEMPDSVNSAGGGS